MGAENLFSSIYIKVSCPGCRKKLMVILSDAATMYGFICPSEKCKTLTSADSMWLLVLKENKKNNS